MKFKPKLPAIYGETLESLTAAVVARGEAPFRAKQIVDWLYKKRVVAWEQMVNLPAALRQWLAESYTLDPATVDTVHKADDITEKLLLRMEDGSLIETVLIRYPMLGVGQEESRKTVCISTQVGCAYGCKFCASGLEGWKRDLSAGEILSQLMHVVRLEEGRALERDAQAQAPFDNIVVMGMGEPLSNYDNVMRALTTFNASWGMKFGARRVTVSTSGLVPQIKRLATEPVQFRLAISLHGATNEVRQQIMPVNRKYPLEELLSAAKEFAAQHGRMLTLEFILIEALNDTLEQAEKLSAIAKDLHAHVNLIPYNTVEGLPWKRPSILRQRRFGSILRDAGVSYTIRKEKGHDIAAACGQLRLQKERTERAAGATAVA